MGVNGTMKKLPLVIIAIALLMSGCVDSEDTNVNNVSESTNLNEVANVDNDSEVIFSDIFYPSGWMGDYNDISINNAYIENPYSKPTCIQIKYSPSGPQRWTGIYWQYPENNWGNESKGIDLSDKTKVTFFARGENGGEKAEFKVGGITEEKYKDSIKNPVSTGKITLSDRWQQYTIDLTGQSLQNVIGGFCWVTSKSDNPSGCTIYLDDIKYE